VPATELVQSRAARAEPFCIRARFSKEDVHRPTSADEFAGYVRQLAFFSANSKGRNGVKNSSLVGPTLRTAHYIYSSKGRDKSESRQPRRVDLNMCQPPNLIVDNDPLARHKWDPKRVAGYREDAAN
jgi:hypothetical protein